MIHEGGNQFLLKRLLICGLGSIGRRHARIFKELVPTLELAVYRSGYGKDCSELELMSHIFTDLTQAISWKPDAAVIASPAPFHQQQALLLARSGIPLLIEKPLGTGYENPQGWEELIDLYRNVKIAIGYFLRQDPCSLYVKENIESQELGKVLEAEFYCGSWLPQWRPELDYRDSVSSRKSLGGGVLLELSHEIDLAYWLLGDFSIVFSSLQKSDLLDVDVEDKVLIIGSGINSSLITIRTNFCTFPTRRSVLIRCENGDIDWNLMEGEVKVQSRYHVAKKFRIVQQPDDRYRLQAERFITSIWMSHPPYCSLDEGLKVMDLINQVRLKAIEKNLE